jgi:hypothetical protein
MKPYKNPPDAIHPFTRFDMTIDVQCQDHMAWETQGPLSDRTHERLATSDRGIVMLREMMMRELDKVEKGFDPLGVIRNPAENTVIDTKLAQSLQGPEFRRNLRAAAAGG